MQKAEGWIRKWKSSGVLTRYPIDISVYDWAIKHDSFRALKEEHKGSAFIEKFSWASQDHRHYENGIPESS